MIDPIYNLMTLDLMKQKIKGHFFCGESPLTMRSGRPVVKSHHWARSTGR